MKKAAIKKEVLRSPCFIALVQELRLWLYQVGYSPSSVYQLPLLCREFFLWLEAVPIYHSQSISQKLVAEFIQHFKTRPNKRRSAGVSKEHVNKQIYALKKLAEFLLLQDRSSFIVAVPYQQRQDSKLPNVLSLPQVKSLYLACANDLLGHRDRCLLHIFYGCGLRRSEGVNLACEDINLATRSLLVRRSKNGRQRLVPLAPNIMADIQDYLHYYRPLLLGQVPDSAFFISLRGKAIQGQSLYIRFKKLLDRANIDNHFGLHTLRHSIATHLLHQEIPLERIAQFLGHQTLDSTHYILISISNNKNSKHENTRLFWLKVSATISRKRVC